MKIKVVPKQEQILDLHKAYGALDRERALEILESYGWAPRSDDS